MSILVTGATGLVGGNVVRQLLKRGEEVCVLAREKSDPRPIAGLDIEVRHGDIRDADAVEKAARGRRAVVHAAAHVHLGWNGMELARAINVEGSINVARAARAAGARMIHVSSIDALGMGTRENPITEESPYTPRTPCPYAITKREAEVALQEMAGNDLDLVIVNPAFLFGPWDWKPSSGELMLEIARRRPLIAPRAINDFACAVDVANAIATAIDKAPTGERYILSGEPHTYLEVFRTIADVCDVRGPLFAIGPIAMHIGGYGGDVIAKITGREGPINSAVIRLMRQPHFYSHEKATRELGYQSRDLRAMVEETWAWFLEHGYVDGDVAKSKRASERIDPAHDSGEVNVSSLAAPSSRAAERRAKHR